jgi:hypothetical protein
MVLRVVLLVLGLLAIGPAAAQPTALTGDPGPEVTSTVSRAEFDRQAAQLSALQSQIADANARQVVQLTHSDAIRILLWMTAGFVALSVIVFIYLAHYVRREFWQLAAQSGPDAWRTYLMQLPLGVPEGSVRALVSLFVIIFGLVVIVMQKQLGLENVEAISGFVGIVITFYFTARSGDQAQKAVDAAKEATARTTEANEGLRSAASALEEAKRTVAATPVTVPSAVSASAPAGPTTAQQTLRDIRERIAAVRQVAGMASRLGVGTEILAGADSAVQTADGLLGAIDPLLSGHPDAGAVATVLQRAEAALGPLENLGLPGALADGIATLRGALDIAGPIVASIPGGPIGIVGGIVMAGVKLAQNQRQFETLKTALLNKPFDPALLPAVVDGVAATAALDISPHLRKLLGGMPPVVATALMREVIQRAPGGGPVPLTEIAARLMATGLDAEGTNVPFAGRVASAEELVQALEEYRGSLVFQAARQQLDGSVELPAAGGQAATAVSLQSLADAARAFEGDPAAASQIERLVFLAEALSKLQIGAGTGGIADLVGKALGAALSLLPSRAAQREEAIRPEQP